MVSLVYKSSCSQTKEKHSPLLIIPEPAEIWGSMSQGRVGKCPLSLLLGNKWEFCQDITAFHRALSLLWKSIPFDRQRSGSAGSIARG